MIRLPVSAIEAKFRRPDGADEIAFNEGDPAPLAAALRLLDRVAARVDDAAADWAHLSMTDFEILLLQLREFLIGPVIASYVACPFCGERVEVSFRITDYIAAVHPSIPSGLTRSVEGWLGLHGAVFRVPQVADLQAASQSRNPVAVLRARCITQRASAQSFQRIERVIARLAPPVSGQVGGACPDCGTTLSALFEVASFVVTELRRLTAHVYAEVHQLAAAHGWAEAAILALPASRRRRYADLVRSDARSHASGA
jgi:hypothetical protein